MDSKRTEAMDDTRAEGEEEVKSLSNEGQQEMKLLTELDQDAEHEIQKVANPINIHPLTILVAWTIHDMSSYKRCILLDMWENGRYSDHYFHQQTWSGFFMISTDFTKKNAGLSAFSRMVGTFAEREIPGELATLIAAFADHAVIKIKLKVPYVLDHGVSGIYTDCDESPYSGEDADKFKSRSRFNRVMKKVSGRGLRRSAIIQFSVKKPLCTRKRK